MHSAAGERVEGREARFGSCLRSYLDAELVQRSVAGDHGAARELHRSYLRVAAAFLRSLGVRSEESEDACQEVFLQFFRYLPSFRGESEIRTWLFRLCVSEARRIRRRRRIGAALASMLRRQPLPASVPPATRSEATIQALVRQALDRMQPEQREAFLLFEVEGRTGREVAAIGGRSLPASFRRLYEAKRVFNEVLDLPNAR
jgi:RNA polymerase sigma-70 factor, ECF subfamily